MKYKRPDSEASTESWVTIWLGCMGVKFGEHSPQTSSTTEGHYATEYTPAQYTGPTRKKHPTSLHQISCGHGFDPGDRTVFHELWNNSWAPDYSLGGSPRERLTYRIRVKKDLWNWRRNKF